MDSSIRMTFLCSARSVICVFAPFFVGFFFLPRMGMYARSSIAAWSSSLPERFFAASSETGRPVVRPPRLFLSLRDVDELALAAERARDDLQLADLAERARTRRGRVGAARRRRRRDAPDRRRAGAR